MRRLCVYVLAAGALASCASPAREPAGSAPPPPAAASAASPAGSARVATPPATDTPAVLRFTGTTLDGARFDGAGLTGKPVVFWFWAPWCPKCRSEGPAVAKIAEKYRGRVSIVGVAGLDRGTAKMTEFVERTGTAGLPQLNDGTGEIYRHFGVAAQSSYRFVDPAGKTESATGPLDENELSALIDRHLL